MSEKNTSFFDRFNKFIKEFTTSIALIFTFIGVVYMNIDVVLKQIEHVVDKIISSYSRNFPENPPVALELPLLTPPTLAPELSPTPIPVVNEKTPTIKTTLQLKSDQNKCSIARSQNRALWKENFILEVKDNTFHVFVFSLSEGEGKDKASEYIRKFERNYLGIHFEPMETVGADGKTLWAIVIAQGIKNINLAREICTYAVKCNIRNDSYIYEQSGRNMGCFAR